MLQLSLLGPFRLRTAAGMADIPYQRARALLAYLVLEPGPHRREQLAELLWPDQGQAAGRESLRRMVHLLRQALGEDASRLVSSRDTLAWDGPIDCDALSLAAARPLCAHSCDPLTRHRCIADGQAQALGAGQLLADIVLDQCPDFEIWLHTRRTQWQRHLRDLHERLLNCCQRAGQQGDALHHARQLLVLEPWDETALTRLLRLLVAQGDLGAAHAEYAAFCTRLQAELGSQPSPTLADYHASLPLPRPTASPADDGSASRQLLAVLVARYQPPAGPDGDTDPAAGWPQFQAWQTRQSERLRAWGAQPLPLPAAALAAYFGLPQADDQDGRRAVDAALEISDRDCAIGVHAGWAWRDASAPLGADPGGLLAAKALSLAHACPVGEVRVSPGLANQVFPAFHWADAAIPDNADNPDHPAAALRPLHRHPGAAQADSAHPASDPAGWQSWQSASLHGRSEELAWLDRHWRQTQAGSAHSLLLTAPAGLGKSRLVREWLAASGAPVLTVACRPEWAYSAFRPWLEACRQHGLPLPAEWHASLSPLPDPQARQGQVEGWADAVSQGQEDAPTVLWVDDAHWLDPSSLDVLRTLAARAEPPRLLLLTARTGEGLDWPGLVRQQLAPLPAGAMQALAADLGRQQNGNRCREALAAAIARAAGVPLFLEALLQAGNSADELPASLESVLGSQIARLGEAHTAAAAAAVLGSQFTPAQLRAVLTTTPEAEGGTPLGQRLAQLEARGLIAPDPDQPDAYVFRHALLRDAVLASLRLPERQALHAQAAAALLAHEPELAKREPERLALHYREAGQADDAVRWLTRAVARDARRYAYHEAVHHGEAALALLSQLPPGPATDASELALRLHLGLPLMAVHGYGSAPVLATYGRAHQLAGPLPDAPEFFPLLWGLWLVSSSTSHYRYSRDLAERLVRLANLRPAEQDPWCRAHAYYALGNSLACLGEFAAATVVLEEALRLAPDVPTASPYGEDAGVTAGSFLGLTRWCRGQPHAAREAADRAVLRARALQEPHSLAFSLIFVAMLGTLCDDSERVQRSASEARQLATQHRLALWQVAADVFLAWSGLRNSAPPDPTHWEALQQCVTLSRTVMAGVEGFFLAIAADACERSGLTAPIPELARRGLELTTEKHDHLFEANFLRLLGLTAPTANERRRALAQSEQRARQQGAIGFLNRLGSTTIRAAPPASSTSEASTAS